VIHALIGKSKICIVGAGSLGSIIAKNLALHHEGEITATRRNIEEIAWLEEYGIRISSDNSLATDSDVVILAVKPKSLEALADLEFKNQLVVSLAAGRRVDGLMQLFNYERIVRVMPMRGLQRLPMQET
jgi:pyrroline-5-carboxylate reductase